ncbi:MAG: response regulator [Chloroflexales bacterium]|nr:response regulator [Chloroflexales bacterium]
MADPSVAQQQIQLLRTVYTAQLAEKLDRLRAGRHALVLPPWNPERAIEYHRQAHNLAGSGATFGYSELSLAARCLEQTLMPLCEQTAPPTTPQLEAIDRALEALGATVRALRTADAPGVQALAPPTRPVLRTQTLVLVDDDPQANESLAIQLGYFGYSVHTVSDLDALPGVVHDVSPTAIVLSLAPPESGQAEVLAATLRGPGLTAMPIVFLAQRTDLEARLQAVRAGGSAFVPKPVDVSDLVMLLDTLTSVAPPEPYRVLIVDDSVLVARTHALILRAAGMQASVVNDPVDLLPALAEQQPDLVLMDMYLPGCEGHELAAMIRQQAAFHGMPIVFLSAETDREIQLAAMGQGGDDFLTKPVPPAHLVAAVKSRVERARAIRGQLNRDSLTGLLTHAATTEQLVREQARVQRYGSWLSVAMIDIDHFKRVNDTYGHATGDRVLKSLARLLRQQLRASDVVGRYGGEEFVVLLPDTDSEQAHGVLERVRERFTHVLHQAGEASFTVTFSAGVASLPPFDDCNGVLEAADAALYGAKQGGRNRVLLAKNMTASVLAASAYVRQGAPSIDAFGPAMRHEDGSPIRGLVVDDDGDLRAVLASWLAGWGWAVELAASGAEALACIEQSPPDVVLLDALMPGLGGLEVLKEIRARALDMAVIMVTAFSSEQLAIGALRHGADDYVRKPLEPAALRAVLERTLSHLVLRREHAALQRRLSEELARSAEVQTHLLRLTTG